MKKFYLAIVCFVFCTYSLLAQDIKGAWETTFNNSEGKEIRFVVVFTESHQVATMYHAKTGAFIETNGGFWSLKGNTITEIVEFKKMQMI